MPKLTVHGGHSASSKAEHKRGLTRAFLGENQPVTNYWWFLYMQKNCVMAGERKQPEGQGVPVVMQTFGQIYIHS